MHRYIVSAGPVLVPSIILMCGAFPDAVGAAQPAWRPDSQGSDFDYDKDGNAGFGAGCRGSQ